MVCIEKFNAGLQLTNQYIFLGMLEIIKLSFCVPIADGMSHRKLV